MVDRDGSEIGVWWRKNHEKKETRKKKKKGNVWMQLSLEN